LGRSEKSHFNYIFGANQLLVNECVSVFQRVCVVDKKRFKTSPKL
jgi:hypothetical protein